jgi:hypothetical protein
VRRRRLVVLLVGWLAIAAIPAALTVPSGAWQPEPGLPTPFVFMDTRVPAVPLTPGLLLAHPESRRDSIAMTPWTVISATGFVVLLDLTAPAIVLTTAVAAILGVGAIYHGAQFVRSYFRDYPIVAAPYFQYGMQQAIAETQKVASNGEPVVITNRMEMPYIYVLFFESYPPELFQRGPVTYLPGAPGSSLYAGVAHFDDFWFVDPQVAFMRMAQAVFVFPGNQFSPAPPVASIRYPDGRTAYNIVVK